MSAARSTTGHAPAGLIATPSLLALPFELRTKIYGYLFHDAKDYLHYFHDDQRVLRDHRARGCRCGNDLSRVNWQLFNELLSLRYNHKQFIFSSPDFCLRFIRRAGTDIQHIWNIELSVRNVYAETLFLKEIFQNLKTYNNLITLTLIITDSDWRPLAYIPYSEKSFPALTYDLLLRPPKHPLEDLTNLQNLSVRGHPTCEVEEAIFRLVNTMKGRQRRLGGECLELITYGPVVRYQCLAKAVPGEGGVVLS